MSKTRMTARSLRKLGSLTAVLAASLALGASPTWAQSNPPVITIDDNATVSFPAMTVPAPEYLSPQGKAYLIEHLQAMQQPEMLKPNDEGVPRFLAGYLARQREVFAVDKKDATIAGVHVVEYQPKDAAAKNQKRVLIDLHGGGFQGCFQGCAELESRPLAALGGFRVVSVDYRQGPQYRHPAAIEDVAAVYRELLKTYPATNIGIYGCSAGGVLTAMSVSWFQNQKLPRPGAIGVFCAGGTAPAPGTIGDSAYLATALGEARVTPIPNAAAQHGPSGYLENADLRDPVVAPALHDKVLAQFPPTLMISGTRAMDLSSSAYLNSRLVLNNVEAELHVWEGMFHGFFYNPDVPESHQAYDVMVRFFDRHLGH